jgi:hypothetical protein
VRAPYVVFVLAACAAPPSLPNFGPRIAADPPEVHADQTRHYSIWLGGARVGTAIEAESWSPSGVHLERTERMRFLRADTDVELATTIAIDADLGLVAHRVHWSEAANGIKHTGDAIQDGGVWRSNLPGVSITSGAVPAELVPLIVRRDGRFAGAVFLPARNFTGGRGRIDQVAPDRLVARLELDGGLLAEATIDRASDGMPARVVDGEGVIALRITAAQARLPFTVTDLVAATAVPITGRRSHHLVLDGDLVVPALPGQAATAAVAGVSLELGAQLPGALPPPPSLGGEPDRSAEIRGLVANVRARITPDLAATPTSSRDADAATAGDCTTFALAYTALAERRGIPTRVVTGLRIDGDRLVRHRWAVSWTGRAWIAVDAAFGAVPAGGDLVGLAIHDADDAGLVSGEAALTHVRGATWN